MSKIPAKNSLVDRNSQFIAQFSYDPHCIIGDVCDLINGDRSKNYPSGKDRVPIGIPFINAGNLDGKTVCFADMEYITEEKFQQISQGRVQKDDILYCLRGSLGKHGMVHFDKGLIASSLVIIRCKKHKIIPQFLMCALETEEISRQLHAANNGSSQPNLSAASVKKYQIPLPDLDRQCEFAAFVQQSDKSKLMTSHTNSITTSLFMQIYSLQ